MIIGHEATSTSCQPATRSGADSAAPDSVVGVVAVTGTSFEQRIVLRSGDGITYLAPGAAHSIALSGLGGMEVVVAGKRDSKGLRVARFTVVRLNGAPVVDGVLKIEGGRLVLDTRDGVLPLGNPPEALRGMVGARVWISGPLDTGPNSFGVIAARQ